MATIHLKNIPDDVYGAVQRQAMLAGRSVAAELRRILADSVAGARRDPEEVLRSIERVRQEYPVERFDVASSLAADRGR